MPIIYFLLENELFKMLYILFIIKLIMEFIIYAIGTFKFKNKFNILNFIIWYFLEIPYVVFVGVGSFFAKYIMWRGQSFQK